MKLKHIAPKVTSWIQEAVRVQVMLMVASLLVLNIWGLPLSALGIIGNLLCAPVAMVFLSVGFLYMFLATCGLAVPFLGSLLDCYIAWWHALLASVASPPELVFPALPVAAAVGAGLLLCYFVYIYAVRLPWWQEIVCYMGVGLLCMVYGFSGSARHSVTIKAGGRHVYAVGLDSATYVIVDPFGALPREDRIVPWWIWSVRTTCACALGAKRACSLIELRPTQGGVMAITTLLQRSLVQRAIVPQEVLDKKTRLAIEHAQTSGLAIEVMPVKELQKRYSHVLRRVPATARIAIDKIQERCNTPSRGSTGMRPCRKHV